MIGFAFLTPWLLLGLLAGAIPFILHLTSSARAKEVYFPTLRLIRMSMEKTTHRRRVKNWMLLLLRAFALICLAIALAQPISKAIGNFGPERYAAVIILDDSFSMNANRKSQSRFDYAVSEALKIIDGTSPPSSTSLMLASQPSQTLPLDSNLSNIRKQIKSARTKACGVSLDQCVTQASEILNSQNSFSNKRIYLLSDLQKVSLDENLLPAAESDDTHLLVINCGTQTDNVSVTNASVEGNWIVNAPLKISATLNNSSQTARQVNVALQLLPAEPIQKQLVRLGQAGSDNANVKINFHTKAPPSDGQLRGQVVILEEDALAQDNLSRFCITLADRINTLIITSPDESDTAVQNPAATLSAAISPWSDRSDIPWSITHKIVNTDDFTRTDLDNVQAVYIADAAEFSSPQADALREFVNNGGSVMIFLGPEVYAQSYNRLFGDDFLPAEILPAVGQVGPDAPAVAVSQVDLSDPYLKGLYEQTEDYLAGLVQRYFKLKRTPSSSVLMRLENSDPIIVSHKVSSGRVTLCGTTVSSRWSNFAGSGARIIVPMILRCAMLSKQAESGPQNFTASNTINLLANTTVETPDQKQHKVPLSGKFDQTYQTGWYKLFATPQAQPKWLAVNPPASQRDIQSFNQSSTFEIFTTAGWKNTFIETDLQKVTTQATLAAKPQNYWDITLIIVLLALVLETLIANITTQKK